MGVFLRPGFPRRKQGGSGGKSKGKGKSKPRRKRTRKAKEKAPAASTYIDDSDDDSDYIMSSKSTRGGRGGRGGWFRRGLYSAKRDVFSSVYEEVKAPDKLPAVAVLEPKRRPSFME